MRLFGFTKKKKQSSTLVGTAWICTSTNETETLYYKLVFTDEDQVEGWVKYISQEEEVIVFSADYKKTKNVLHVKKEDDIFMAVFEKSQLTAVLDGQKMSFSKSQL